jgi:hypothetical protein
MLGRVDGFDQDEAESKRDERAVILRRLLASKCDTLEALELADRLFDACPCLVECFRKEGGHILGVGSTRDCRTYSALVYEPQNSAGLRETFGRSGLCRRAATAMPRQGREGRDRTTALQEPYYPFPTVFTNGARARVVLPNSDHGLHGLHDPMAPPPPNRLSVA